MMKKCKKLTALLCVVAILFGMTVTAPTALAADENQWVEKAPMPVERYNFACEYLNGKIYVVGGCDKGNYAVDTMQIYDIETNTWNVGKSLPKVLQRATSAVIDGKIYVIGGYNQYNAQDTVYIYNPETNNWSSGASMKTDKFGATSEVVDGKIYVIGGYDGRSKLNSVEIYDPKTDTWNSGEPMPTSRDFLVSTVINGKIYAIGGREHGEVVEIYNPKTNVWTSGKTTNKIEYPSPVVTVNNQLYILGASEDNKINGVYNISKKVLIYNPVSENWGSAPDMINPHSEGKVVFVGDTIYVIGGRGENGKYLNTVETLKLSGGTVVERKLAVALNVGENVQLSVSDNLAENTSFTWTTSDSKVATVDTNGKVTAVGVGTCDISAQNADGTWKESIPVRVFPGTADLYRLAVHLKPTQTAKLYLTENPSETTWSSLDTSIATINAEGKVSAVSDGLAIMQGAVNGETYQIYVRVKQ